MWASELSNDRPEPTEGTGAILYFRNAMVPTEINEQIQWAAYSPAMFVYLRGLYEWTDNQLRSVNWRAMRLASTTQTASVNTYIKNASRMAELGPQENEAGPR